MQRTVSIAHTKNPAYLIVTALRPLFYFAVVFASSLRQINARPKRHHIADSYIYPYYDGLCLPDME